MCWNESRLNHGRHNVCWIHKGWNNTDGNKFKLKHIRVESEQMFCFDPCVCFDPVSPASFHTSLCCFAILFRPLFRFHPCFRFDPDSDDRARFGCWFRFDPMNAPTLSLLLRTLFPTHGSASTCPYQPVGPGLLSYMLEPLLTYFDAPNLIATLDALVKEDTATSLQLTPIMAATPKERWTEFATYLSKNGAGPINI